MIYKWKFEPYVRVCMLQNHSIYDAYDPDNYVFKFNNSAITAVAAEVGITAREVFDSTWFCLDDNDLYINMYLLSRCGILPNILKKLCSPTGVSIDQISVAAHFIATADEPTKVTKTTWQPTL